jgi:hypothetical protein
MQVTVARRRRVIAEARTNKLNTVPNTHTKIEHPHLRRFESRLAHPHLQSFSLLPHSDHPIQKSCSAMATGSDVLLEHLLFQIALSGDIGTSIFLFCRVARFVWSDLFSGGDGNDLFGFNAWEILCRVFLMNKFMY